MYEANEIVDLLASIPERDFTPIMQTFNQKPGLIQLFFDQIPMQAGKNINAMIDGYASKSCKNLREYTCLFQEQLQKIQDTSDDAKLSRTRMSRDSTLMEDRENNRFKNTPGRLFPTNNDKFNNNINNKIIPYKNNERYNNNNNNNNINNNNNNNNNGNHQMVPYKNPHEGRLHHLSESQVCEEYYNKCDVEDYDEYRRELQKYSSYSDYDDNLDEHNVLNDSDYYDYDEVFGNRPDCIEGRNPGANVIQNLSNINNTENPCFDELNGKCLKGARECKYSHDPIILGKEAVKRIQLLQKCKYLPREYRQNTQQNIPTSILKRDHNLRAIGPAEDLLEKQDSLMDKK
jgi:hypothetical protein